MSHQQDDQLLSLKREIVSLQHELHVLQSSRSHRIAKFARQLLSSRLSEAPKILKNAPELVKRYSVPPPKTLSPNNRFNPLYKSLPLLHYPSINVAIACEQESLQDILFRQTCNTFDLEGTLFPRLIRYDAIQLVVIDMATYKKDVHLERISEAIAHGAQLFIIGKATKPSVLPSELKKHSPSYLTFGFSKSAKNIVMPFADIYSIKQKSIQRELTDSHHVDSTEKLNSIDHTRISIIRKSVINHIETTNSLEEARLLTERIASYCPVIFEGSAPTWIDSSTKSYANDTQLEKILNELGKPYQAERYAISCGREIVINSNSLTRITPILQSIGLTSSNTTQVGISTILSTKRPHNVQHALEQLEAQTITPNQVIVMLHGASKSECDQVTKLAKKSRLHCEIHQIDADVLFGDVLNQAVEYADQKLVTKIDDDDYYLPHHLADLYAAWLSTKADYVGKWNNWVYLAAEDKTISWIPESANSYVQHLPGGTFLTTAQLLREVRFGKISRAIDSEMYKRAIERGATLYSTHRYNYVRVRADDHTYLAADADFKSRATDSPLSGLPLDEVLSA